MVRQFKGHKSVKFLLCLLATFTMMSSSVVVSVSAAETDVDLSNTIRAYDEDNGFLSVNSDGSIRASKSGYYLFFDSYDEYWGIADDTRQFELVSELVSTEDAYKHLNQGDILPYNFEDNGAFFIGYKENENSEAAYYTVEDIKTVNLSYEDGELFSFSIAEQSANSVTLHFSATAKEGRLLSGFTAYLDGELYDNSANVIPEEASSCEFDYTVYSNGKYTFQIDDSLGYGQSADLEVNCIDYNAVVSDEESPDPLTLSYSLSTNDTGLSAEDTVTIQIDASCPCSITADGFKPCSDVTSASFDVHENGVYTFYASDMDTANTTSIEVTVTNFGDGSLPDYTDPDNLVDPTAQDDNPLSDKSHGSYWEDAANNLYDEDGTLIKNLVNEDEVSNNAKKPSDSMSVLPQTGITSWVVALSCSVAAVAVGVFLIFRKGIVAKLFRKGG